MILRAPPFAPLSPVASREVDPVEDRDDSVRMVDSVVAFGPRVGLGARARC